MAAILLYHAVSNEVTDPALQISPATLDRHLAWCSLLGYRLSSLEDVLTKSEDRLAAVTFDDGLASIDATLRLFLKRGLEPTVFLCPGLVGTKNTWASPGRVRERLFTWNELKSLRDLGVSFGCHGWNHRLFVGLDAQEMCDDIERCLESFARELKVVPAVFSWPFGRFDEAAFEVISRFFPWGLAVEPSWGEDVRSRAIPRLSVPESSSWEAFADELELKAFRLIEAPCPLDLPGTSRIQ
jgi:peptidoglycan/xylan/chitin deacetylase (PgdA/CDA1 family)